MKREKILYIVEGFGGGVYSYIVQLANEMINYYDITLAYSIRPETPDTLFDDFDKRIKMVDLQNKRELSFSSDIKGFFKIRDLIKEEKPDILHLHSSKAGVMGRIMNVTVRGRKNRKVFYNPHGFSFLQTDISKIKRNIFYFIEWFTSKFGGTIVAVSKGEGEEASKFSKRVKVINNSIKLDEIDEILKMYNEVATTSDIKEDNKFKIATLARISVQKNPELFNEVAEATDDNYLWIGDGELRDKLTSSNIEIAGWQLKPDGLRMLCDSDIFMLTSRWEGLPISLLEAMALGKVCIVTNVIGNKDVIVNGENGFIANNKEEFVEIIEKLRKNPELFNKISKNARKCIEEEFEINIMFDNYRKLYSE